MAKNNGLIEIRWHGRGGQGAVTSAEMLAQAAISEGRYGQAFPAFGPERRGAPVLAFVRVSDNEPIRIRAGITEPDAVVILDPRLLSIVDASAGLKPGGTFIVNTRKTPDEIRKEFGFKFRLATVNATKIAREILGVPIVNTTMIGAVIKVTNCVKLESVEEPLKERFGKLGQKNIDAMKRAYQETVIKE